MNPYRRIAEELKEHPERWIKFQYAHTKNRDTCHPGDLEAVAWCAAGLCLRDHIPPEPVYRATRRKSLDFANDLRATTIADVIGWFETAAEETAARRSCDRRLISGNS